MTFQSAVKSDPEILGGALCFAGTRVPVRNLFDYLEGGNRVDDFLESFDWVSRDQVTAVLERSADLIETQTNQSDAA
jgi:uncharacterized protein (DUF433 family)